MNNLVKYVSPGGRNLTPEKRLIRKNSLARKAVIGPHFKLVTGARKIGEGQYGKVFGGYRKVNRVAVVRKVTKYTNKRNIDALVTECKLHVKIYKYVPQHVSKVFKCGINGSMNMERIQGGDLASFFKMNLSMLDDYYMRIIILQVLSVLKKIHAKDPSFRHNDLHLGNILVDNSPSANKPERINNFVIPPIGVRVVLTDFGMAVDSVTKNPYHTSSYRKNYGIYAGSDYMYDSVLFLNEIYSLTRKHPSRFPLTNMFLKDVLSGGYSAHNGNNTHVFKTAHGRMRANHKYKFDFSDLFAHPYFVVPLQFASIYMTRNSRNSKWKSVNVTPSVVKKWGGTYAALKQSPKSPQRIPISPMNNSTPVSVVSSVRKTPPKKKKLKSPVIKKKTKQVVILSPIINTSPPKKKKLKSPVIKKKTKQLAILSPIVNKSPSLIHSHLNNYAAKLNITKSKPKHILQYFRNSGASTPQAKQATKALVERFVSPSSARDEAWIKARNALAGSGITIHKF
jgi:serine/threonine protein kinase